MRPFFAINDYYPVILVKTRDSDQFGRKELVFLMCQPEFLSKDGGAGAIGKFWGDYAGAYDICSIVNPTNAPSQIGIVGFAVCVINFGLHRILLPPTELTIEEAVRFPCIWCIGGNLCQVMASGFSPSALDFGRSNLFGVIENESMGPILCYLALNANCNDLFRR